MFAIVRVKKNDKGFFSEFNIADFEDLPWPYKCH